MLSKLFGSISKTQYEKWIGIIGLIGFLWCGILSTIAFVIENDVIFPISPVPITCIGLSGAAYSLSALIWSIFIGKGKFAKYRYLKMATVGWVFIDISALLALGYSLPVVSGARIFYIGISFMIAILISGAVLIYFILSKIEKYARDD